MSTFDVAAGKAATLVEALPYIRSYRGQTVVVKIGGAALDDPAIAPLVAIDLALLGLVGIQIVVVHGGGPQVSAAMEAAGIEPHFVNGLRITDPMSMEIVRRVLVGSINPDLVARLNRAGLKAVGLAGSDSGMMQTELASGPDDPDLGRVAHITDMDTTLLTGLLEQGFTPVIASVATAPDGNPVNINADEAAGAVAFSLGAAKLVYLTNVTGLYGDLGDEGTLISEISLGELATMLEGLSEGMRPKALSVIAALSGGVGKAHILDGRVPHALLLEVFTKEGIGTQVLA